jgi:type I restriction enzyme M protein
MTIVLPHGVLFRGNEEETIRMNLIEKNNIDTIIGLPENIFYGTPIRTIIMILKRTRPNTDVLYIDASTGFEKSGKKNILRASDIKRIADVVKARAEVPGFSILAKKEQIVANNYNLNIPRYLDSFEPAEPWDIHSIMFLLNDSWGSLFPEEDPARQTLRRSAWQPLFAVWCQFGP